MNAPDFPELDSSIYRGAVIKFDVTRLGEAIFGDASIVIKGVHVGRVVLTADRDYEMLLDRLRIRAKETIDVLHARAR